MKNKVEEKYYFYCASYQSFLLSLYYQSIGRKIAIITPSGNIDKACSYLQIPSIKIQSKDTIQLLKQVKKTKQDLGSIIQQTDDGIVCFTHTQFDVFCFLLVNELSRKKKKVFFYDFEYEYPISKSIPVSVRHIKFIIHRTLLNLLYQADIIVKSMEKIFVLSIDKTFFQKRPNIIKIDIRTDYYSLIDEAIRFTSIDYPEIDFLYLHEDFIKLHFVEENSFYTLMTYINNIGITIKNHPNAPPDERFNQHQKIVPSFLPAELLFGKVNVGVLAVNSAALISASKFPDLKVISLMHLLDFRDKEYTKIMEDDLIYRSNNKILFPSSYEELTKLLNERHS